MSWLICFCTKGEAAQWREMWNEWSYSDVLELYAARIRSKKMLTSELDSSLSERNIDRPAMILKKLFWLLS